MAMISRVVGAYTRANFAVMIAMALLGFASSRPAAATVTEILSAKTTVSYSFGDGSGATFIVDDNGSGRYDIGNISGNLISNVNLAFEIQTSSDDRSFHFLNSIQCIGTCSVSAITELTSIITNTGSDTVDLRYDSHVTPGHLAGISGVSASLAFEAVAFTGSDTASAAYLRTGYIDNGSPHGGQRVVVDPLNGLNSFSTSDAGAVDWSGEILSLDIPALAPSESRAIVYTLSMSGSSSGSCTTLVGCMGVQIAFGDPRNNGSASRQAGPTVDMVEGPVSILGREYYPTAIISSAVTTDTPPPPQPEVFPPVPYTQGPLAAVPEASTWMMMVIGFGAIGAMVRRRRTALAVD